MSYIVRMPKLGLEMEEGTVLEWAVDEGESVSEGDRLAEVESEKSIGEVEAREDGVLRRVYVGEGETVSPSVPIGIVAATDADIADLESEAEDDLAAEGGEADTAGETADADAGAQAGSGTVRAAGGPSSAEAATDEGGETDVKASPRAEKRAEELEVDLTTVEGTGPGGAVTADDVESAAESGAASESGGAAEEVKASPRAEKRAEELGVDLSTVEGTGPGGAITADDVEAAAEARERESPGAEVRRVVPEDAAAYRYDRATAVADPAAASALFDAMRAVRNAFEERATLTDVLLVVASATLADCPAMNATYEEKTHQLRDEQHVALAVGVDGEPTAGVISAVRERTLSDLVAARRELPGEDADRPTFTLANAAETDSEGLLVNEPAVASLEVDPTAQRAVPAGDGVDLQPLVTAGLTYDTRAVDAADADRFLTRFFERAADASELVLSTYREDA